MLFTQRLLAAVEREHAIVTAHRGSTWDMIAFWLAMYSASVGHLGPSSLS